MILVHIQGFGEAWNTFEGELGDAGLPAPRSPTLVFTTLDLPLQGS
jgi:hypothetical protein